MYLHLRSAILVLDVLARPLAAILAQIESFGLHSLYKSSLFGPDMHAVDGTLADNKVRGPSQGSNPLLTACCKLPNVIVTACLGIFPVAWAGSGG